MQNTVNNFKTEEKVTEQTQKKARRKKMKIFDVSAGKMIEVAPSDWLISELKQSEKEIKAGKGITFNSPQEAIDYLKKEIENEKRKLSKD